MKLVSILFILAALLLAAIIITSTGPLCAAFLALYTIEVIMVIVAILENRL